MSLNTKFYKLRLLKEFLEHTSRARNTLLNELIDQATDQTVYLRRYRMLQQLSQYEVQIIEKIQAFDSTDVNDFASDDILTGLGHILSRSA